MNILNKNFGIKLKAYNRLKLWPYLLLTLVYLSPAISFGGPTNQKFPAKYGIGEMFLGGVYMYRPGNGDNWDEITINAHLRWLSQLGINTIHVNSLSLDTSGDKRFHELAEKHGLKIIYQLDSFYYKSNKYPYGAANEVQEYLSNPNFVAFNVMEEPAKNDMQGLMNYYQDIENIIGEDIPFYLLHNKTSTIDWVNEIYNTSEPIPQYIPEFTGSDRYNFRTTFEAGGYITTPRRALKLLLGESNSWAGFPRFSKNAVPGQSFFGVVTGNSIRKFITRESLANYAQCPQQDCELFNTWIAKAEAINQGLEIDPANQNNVLYWQNYRPPENAMRAQVWTAVASGSHAVSAWSAGPTSTPRELVKQGEESIASMVGEDGKGHRTLFEFASTIGELQKYGWIINRLENREDGSSLINIDAPDLNGSNKSEIISKKFDVQNLNGKVIVLVNGHVGTWANLDSVAKDWLNKDDVFQINNEGEIEGFVPADELYLRLSLSDLAAINYSDIYRLDTGEALSANDGIYLQPGQGILLYLGEHQEMETIRHLSGLSSTIAIHGNLYPDSSNTKNQRVVYPIDPIIGSSSYVMKGNWDDRKFATNTKYRLHVTVSGKNNASFQARVFGFKNGGKRASYKTSIKMGEIKNLTEVPITISSGEFTIPSSRADFGRVYFYRQNRKGEVTIHDAWLEDTSDNLIINDSHEASTTIPAEKQFKLYVEAKNVASTQAMLGLRLLSYDANGNYIEESEITNFNSNMSDNFQIIDTTILATNNSEVHSYGIQLITEANNEVIVKRIWAEEIF